MTDVFSSISSRTVTFYVNGQPYSLDRSAPGYPELRELLQTPNPRSDEDVARMIRLTNPVSAVQDAVAVAEQADYLPRGLVNVTRESVTYNGEPVRGPLVDRIFDMLSEGFGIMPLVRFLENLMQNPTDFAREELYLWLETSDLPITDDGCFLAYKNVRGDFRSIHGGTVDNTPGTVVEMPRRNVDKNRDNTCSTGLHFCSKSYLPHFSNTAGGKTVLLKINPADVVSIPSDYSNAKGRAWKYTVIEEVKFDIPTQVWPAVYSDDADEEYDEFLTFPSDLGNALYAALNEAGIDTRNKDNRLSYVNELLVYQGLEQADRDEDITTFRDLTIGEAQAIIDYLHAVKADEDDAAAEEATTIIDAAEQARQATIRSYGIITLRSKASQFGMPGAWKGPNKAALVAYLIGVPGAV